MIRKLLFLQHRIAVITLTTMTEGRKMVFCFALTAHIRIFAHEL